MFEGAIAAFLNRLLGRYVEDLDAEQFNVGIFSGDTYLTDLKLKPEALYQLGLPIRVEIGLIGKIILKIPWSGLFSQPIVLCIEDLYIVAVPAMSGPYNAEVQKKLIRAEKKKILEDLEGDGSLKSGLPPELFDSLLTSIIKNFQININNVHIRYEEYLSPHKLCTFGICIQSISMTTTNSKWKPGVNVANSQTTYQLIRAESLSVYLDPDAETCLITHPSTWDFSAFLTWKNIMCQALQTFEMNNKEFQFLLKPLTTKVKIIIYKGNQAQASRVLVDIVLQDVAMQILQSQYLAFSFLYDSLQRAVIKRPYVKYRPEKTVQENPSAWWKYAYFSIVEQRIKPYTWENMIKHRKNYKTYKNLYIQSLSQPDDTELKLDLQKYEDCLNILNIVIAREHAKQELEYRNTENDDSKMSEMGNKNVNDVIDNGVNVQATMNANDIFEKTAIANELIVNTSIMKKNLEDLSKPIDYKYNFTLANCSLSLLREDREVLVITITQFLTSIETQPAYNAYKISTRAESFVIEGISVEGDLVSLVTVNNVITGNVSSNFLAIDFEKNAIGIDPDYNISVKLEAMEITYYDYTMMELINFFDFNNSYTQNSMFYVKNFYQIITNKILILTQKIVSQTLRIKMKMDMKAPYIVFPENGSVYKDGYILILDVGNIFVTNELQAMNLQLEDATLMELEELLYDRFCINFAGGQLLFCHSGDDWRNKRSLKDSEFHFLPKVQANVTFSYSTRPEYRQLPRTKLNISISSMKFNLSDQKLRLFMHFLNLLLTLYHYDIKKYKNYLVQYSSEKTDCAIVLITKKDLSKLKSKITIRSVTTDNDDYGKTARESSDSITPKLTRSLVSSEVSEEDFELLSRNMNLCGFDDIVSPSNPINLLLRFAVGELSFHMTCTNDDKEEPYLNLRLHTLYFEAAIMEYGPAIQFGIGTILLVDKTNADVTGSYMELISTKNSTETVAISYRKVRSNCPDFRSHFKNIERSIVINVLKVNISLHKPSLLKLKDYLNTLYMICSEHSLFNFIQKIRSEITTWDEKGNDPPIPPGAIKLNYSARINELILRLSDKDLDLMEIQFLGLENDCIYNANERMVLRAHLRNLTIKDLNHDTFYPNILTTDDDKVLDLKYVRHTPKMYVNKDIDTNQDEVMSDGSFKFSLGRMNILFMYQIFYDFQNFMAPLNSSLQINLINFVLGKVQEFIEEVKRNPIKLHIYIDIQGPTFLLPERKNVPTLIVFDAGILSVENFFKKTEQPVQNKLNSDVHHLIIDNILIKLKCMTICRAIMTLTRDLEIQEPIIEPIYVHFDIKRRTEYRNALELYTCGLHNVQGSIDLINVNISQKDLKTLISVWKSNLSKCMSIEKTHDCIYASCKSKMINPDCEDDMMKKLEIFLAHNELDVYEVNMKVTLEGLQLNLFFDTEEVLSSPVRDLNHGLCRLSFGEIINTINLYSDNSWNAKLSLQNCLLNDTRKDPYIVKKIIQAPAKMMGANQESCISVSMSPIIDATFTQSSTGERSLDILIQEARINLSVQFLINLAKYFIDAIPKEQQDRGITNYGYESGNQPIKCGILPGDTNKLCSTKRFKEQPGTTISLRVRKPEILIFGDLSANNTHIILLQAELTLEMSQHNYSSSFVCTFSDVYAKTRTQTNYFRQSANWLMYPCDIEISKNQDFTDSTALVEIAISEIDIYLTAGVIHTCLDIVNRISKFVNSIDMKNDGNSINNDYYLNSDLWTPKKISNIPYKKIEDVLDNTDMCPLRPSFEINFELKPVMIRWSLQIENILEHVPIIRFETIVSGFIYDWHEKFYLESSLKIHAFCYNIDHENWEPLIELCTTDDINYRPWELILKVCNREAYMINPTWIEPCHYVKNYQSRKKRKDERDCEQDSTDMLFINPDQANFSKVNEMNQYLGCEEDSDSDNDDNDENENNGDENRRKIAKAFNYLFHNNDNSDEEGSDSDNSSAEEDEGLELTPECNVESLSPVLHPSTKTNNHASYIIIHARDKINFTLTTNTFRVLQILKKVFSEAKSGLPIIPTSMDKFVVQNNIGYPSEIQLIIQENVNGKTISRLLASQHFPVDNSPVSAACSPEIESQPVAESPHWVDNENDSCFHKNESIFQPTVFQDEDPIVIYRKITGQLLHISFEGFDDVYMYCSKKQNHSLIPLKPVRHGVRYHLVVETTINSQLHRIISVRSPLLFKNETSYALGLYYKKQLAEKLGLPHIGDITNPFDDNVRIKVIEPDGIYNIPLYIAYHLPIYISPAYLEKYNVSEEGIYWKELNDTINTTRDIYCKGKEDSRIPIFGVKMLCTEGSIMARLGCQVPNYLISIIPPLVFNNQLPFVIDLNAPTINYEVKIEPGEKINMHNLKCGNDVQITIKIPNYLGVQWSGTIKLSSNTERRYVLMNADNERDTVNPFLIIMELNKTTSWIATFQAQYWMINKSGLPLFIQESHSHIIHEIPENELMIFSQKVNKKNMVRLKAHQSEWSLPFSLEGISSMSLIVCKDVERRRKYRILTEMQNSQISPLLTKIITFLPHFVIINKTKKTLRFMEKNDQADLWIDLLPSRETIFWPCTDSMKIRVKWKSSQLMSQYFNITQIGKIVLRMDNGTALCVEIENESCSPFYITFQKYTIGEAPVRVDNLCNNIFLKINQISSGQVTLVNPFQSLLYTWDDPNKPRELTWNIYNNKKKGYLMQYKTDGYGQETVPFVTFERFDSCPNPALKPIAPLAEVKITSHSQDVPDSSTSDSDDGNIELNSSRIGQMRKDKIIVYWVSYIEERQRVVMFTQHEDVFLKVKSLIDPEPSQRELFLSLAGIGISVVIKSHKIAEELLYANIMDSGAHWELYMGKKWKSLTLELSAWIENKYIMSCKNAQIENFIDIDLTKLHMTKPFFGKLRRIYSPAIWLHYRKSVSFTYLQGYIHRIQIDNQLQQATFPVLLHSALQKSFTSVNEFIKLKHTIEFVILKQRKANYSIYKGINVVIRELNINLQEEFLLRLMNDLIPKKIETKHSIATKLRKDVSNLHVTLFPQDNTESYSSKKILIERLYISPVVICLKLLANTEQPNLSSNYDRNSYHNLIKFIFEYGRRGTSERSAELKLACYERDFINVNCKKLLSDVSYNFMTQIIQQFYVLVRSATILGNPQNYNFKSPGDSFYEPDTIAICGDEIAERICQDVLHYLGHNTLETVHCPSLNLNVYDYLCVLRTKITDPCFKNINVPPIISVYDNLYMNEIDLEISGLITSTDSFYQDALKFFLKTLWKRISVFTGKESSSFKMSFNVITSIIRRAQEVGHKLMSRVRLPRHINPYADVEQFSMHKAKGLFLFNSVCKGHCEHNDYYWTHTILSNDGKYIALVSLQNVYLIEKSSGTWNVKWTIAINELTSPPKVVNNKLILNVNKNERVSSPVADWYFESKEVKILGWLSDKINATMVLHMENSICPKPES